MRIKILEVKKTEFELITTNESGPQPQYRRYTKENGEVIWCHYLGPGHGWHEYPDITLLEEIYQIWKRKTSM